MALYCPALSRGLLYVFFFFLNLYYIMEYKSSTLFYILLFFWRMKLATINIQNWLNQPAQYGECLVVHLLSRQLDLALSMLFLLVHVLHYSLDDKHENI